jgi:hypothetical protein
MHQRCPSQKVRHSSLFRQNQKSAQSASKTKNPPHKQIHSHGSSIESSFNA